MADNVVSGAAVGTGPTFATDDIGGVMYPRTKMTFGPDGTATDVDVAAGAALPVQLRNSGGTEIGTAGAPVRTNPTGTTAQPVTDNSGSITVDSAQLPAALGQAAMAASLPVTLASDQSALPVSLASVPSHAVTNAGTFAAQVTSLIPGVAATSLGKAEDAAHASGDTGVMALAVRNDVRGALAGTDGDYSPLQQNASGDLRVDGSGVTQPVSAASLPLPSGAATAAKQPALGTAGSASADVISVQGVASMTALKVDGSAVAQPITDNSGSLTVDSGQLPATLGQKAMTASLPVVLASDQASVPVAASQSGTWTVQPGNTANTTAWKVDGSAVNQPVVGAAAHGASVSGNPVLQGMEARSTDGTAVTSGQAVRPMATVLGKQVVMPYAQPGAFWSYAGAAGGLVTTSGVTAKAAGGAGVVNYITSIQVINSHQTIGTEVCIKDGAGGTVLHRGWAQFAGGGYACKFDPPLKGTAATLVEIAEVTATGTAGVLVDLQGYTGIE